MHNKAKVTGPGIVTGRSGTLGEVHFVAKDVRQQIETLTAMNEKLRTARDLLLPRLMSGELAV